jgi:hypothetical protein
MTEHEPSVGGSDAMRYYNVQKNWKKIKRHLDDPCVAKTLGRVLIKSGRSEGPLSGANRRNIHSF